MIILFIQLLTICTGVGNKTDDITEILLKVVLNTITLTLTVSRDNNIRRLYHDLLQVTDKLLSHNVVSSSPRREWDSKSPL
jgi:hypothetical protein